MLGLPISGPVATGAALVLAAVFALAAVTKLGDRAGTTEGFSALSLPNPAMLSVAVPIGELVIAALLVFARPIGAMLAFATLVGFTVFLIGLVRDGRPVACRCFGGATTEPVSAVTVVRNLAFIGLAVAAL